MITTRANVEEYMKEQRYDLVQVDGIPEGFSYKEPDLKIGSILHKGRLLAFVPLVEWDDSRVWGVNEKELLFNYNKLKNGKQRN